MYKKIQKHKPHPSPSHEPSRQDYITLQQVAAIVGVHVNNVRHYVRSGWLVPATRHWYRIEDAEVLRDALTAKRDCWLMQDMAKEMDISQDTLATWIKDGDFPAPDFDFGIYKKYTKNYGQELIDAFNAANP